MTRRARKPCFICNNALIPRVMVRLTDDENILKREIAIMRRDEAGRLPADITLETRICNNCNITIYREIHIIEDDPQSFRINVLSKTSSQTCLVCNGRIDIHRLTLECRINIFVTKNIYVPKKYVCCNHHLDDRGFLVEDTSLRAEQEEEDQILELDGNTDEPGFITIMISPRFRNAGQHQLWVAFNEEYYRNDDVDDGEIAIFGYYCTCKAGARTLGTCAHITSILWYMGYARHQENVWYSSLKVLRSVHDTDDIEIIDPFVENH